MTITIPCPRCREPLEVPKPAPPQLTCNFCGAVIKNARRPGGPTPVPSGETTAVAASAASARAIASEAKAAPAAVASPPPPPPAAPPSNTGLIIALSAVAVLAVGAGALALYLMPKDNGSPAAAAADENPAPPPPKSDEDEPEEEIRLELVASKKARKKLPPNPRMQKAIDAGVAYLRTMTPARDKAFGKNEHSLGMAALQGLTMLECGVPAEDPDVQLLADTIRKNAPNLAKTYLAAPAILFLDRLHKDKTPPPADRQLIQTLALRLIAAQRGGGLWGYGAPLLPVGPGKGKKAVVRDEKLLLAELRANNFHPREGGGFDLSNTQFAALALWAAKRHGVPVEPALRAAAEAIRAGQDKTRGTWGYHMTSDNHVDSGTCVGLILLALGRAVDNDKSSRADKSPVLDDPAVKAGLKHLANVVRKDARARNAKKARGKLFKADSGGDLYFLWALERTCLILNIEKINGVDWHAWGSAMILDSQLPSGEWRDGGLHSVGVPDTCFALLFLIQANLFQDLTDKLNALSEGAGPPPAIAPPGKR